jgi:hypothetical protein
MHSRCPACCHQLAGRGATAHGRPAAPGCLRTGMPKQRTGATQKQTVPAASAAKQRVIDERVALQQAALAAQLQVWAGVCM